MNKSIHLFLLFYLTDMTYCEEPTRPCGCFSIDLYRKKDNNDLNTQSDSKNIFSINGHSKWEYFD